MSGFKDTVAQDILEVFLNLDDFAESRTVVYDGETYKDIPVVLSGVKQQSRRQLQTDHAQGVYLATDVLHCALADLGGCLPEKGQRLKINDREGGGFFRSYYVAASTSRMGMLRVELEAIDE